MFVTYHTTDVDRNRMKYLHDCVSRIGDIRSGFVRDELEAVIVHRNENGTVNLQVFLDGDSEEGNLMWKPYVKEGKEDGQFEFKK